MLAGFAAAYMSTVGTHLNWGASYLVGDIYKRFLKKGAGEKHYVLVGRLTTVFLFLASIVVTMNLTTIEKAWRFLLALGSGTGLVLILRWYWWRINAWSEISAMLSSMVVSLGRHGDDPEPLPARARPLRRGGVPRPGARHARHRGHLDGRLGGRDVPDEARARRHARRVLPAGPAGRARVGRGLEAARPRARADPRRGDVARELAPRDRPRLLGALRDREARLRTAPSRPLARRRRDRRVRPDPLEPLARREGAGAPRRPASGRGPPAACGADSSGTQPFTAWLQALRYCSMALSGFPFAA